MSSVVSSSPLSDILVCPGCGNKVALKEEDCLACVSCGETYPIVDGTPRMLRPVMRHLLREAGEAVRETARTDKAESVKMRTAQSFGYEWKRFHHLVEEYRQNFLAYMQPHGPEFFRGKRVLDAGCGSGRHAYYAAQFGAEVVAVDLGEAIDVARENTRGAGAVETVQADIYHLPFAPESFDFIYSLGVLHHLPDPEGAFRQLLRYLKPGGEIRIYLYWKPERQPVKQILLSVVNVLRRLTVPLPHQMLYGLSYPLAAFAYLGFVLPYCLLKGVPGLRGLAERLPMKQYAHYPFRVCVNDQFDRFSAPVENRYTREQVRSWLERAELADAQVLSNCGWLGCGRKPMGYLPPV